MGVLTSSDIQWISTKTKYQCHDSSFLDRWNAAITFNKMALDEENRCK
jgi:hypothetical protein